MKGKGKGDRGSKFQDDCPLHFPNLKLVDHTRLCPRYTTGMCAAWDKENQEGHTVNAYHVGTLLTDMFDGDAVTMTTKSVLRLISTNCLSIKRHQTVRTPIL